MSIELEMEEFHEVDSSMIKAVGIRDHFLVVFFTDSSVYRYPDCAELLSDLVSADSVGKFFHREIRNQLCEKLRDDIWPE